MSFNKSQLCIRTRLPLSGGDVTGTAQLSLAFPFSQAGFGILWQLRGESGSFSQEGIGILWQLRGDLGSFSSKEGFGIPEHNKPPPSLPPPRAQDSPLTFPHIPGGRIQEWTMPGCVRAVLGRRKSHKFWVFLRACACWVFGMDFNDLSILSTTLLAPFLSFLGLDQSRLLLSWLCRETFRNPGLSPFFLLDLLPWEEAGLRGEGQAPDVKHLVISGGVCCSLCAGDTNTAVGTCCVCTCNPQPKEKGRAGGLWVMDTAKRARSIQLSLESSVFLLCKQKDRNDCTWIIRFVVLCPKLQRFASFWRLPHPSHFHGCPWKGFSSKRKCCLSSPQRLSVTC